jgi:hypothetical protein
MHGFAFILEFVRKYALGISFDFHKFASILQGVRRGISCDFCGLVSPLGLHWILWICVYFARATPRDFIDFLRFMAWQHSTITRA